MVSRVSCSHASHSEIVTEPLNQRRPFQHKPLDLSRKQIRLLRINHQGTKRIFATLRHYDINQLPPYQALSYTWGDPALTDTIWIDGRPFSIRRNLRDFLTIHLRKQELQRNFIWIDQICSDQESVLEKNHMVPMMADTLALGRVRLLRAACITTRM